MLLQAENHVLVLQRLTFEARDLAIVQEGSTALIIREKTLFRVKYHQSRWRPPEHGAHALVQPGLSLKELGPSY